MNALLIKIYKSAKHYYPWDIVKSALNFKRFKFRKKLIKQRRKRVIKRQLHQRLFKSWIYFYQHEKIWETVGMLWCYERTEVTNSERFGKNGFNSLADKFRFQVLSNNSNCASKESFLLNTKSNTPFQPLLWLYLYFLR